MENVSAQYLEYGDCVVEVVMFVQIMVRWYKLIYLEDGDCVVEVVMFHGWRWVDRG